MDSMIQSAHSSQNFKNNYNNYTAIAIKSYINNKASEWFGTTSITLASLTRYTMGMIQKIPEKEINLPCPIIHHKKSSQKNCLQALFEGKALFISISSIQLDEQ